MADKTPITLQEELQKANLNALQKIVDAKSQTTRRGVRFSMMDTNDDGTLLKTESDNPLEGTILAKSVVTSTDDIKRGGTIQRLAFNEEPTQFNYFQSLWKPKRGLLPDYALKQVAYRDSLVAGILAIRSNHISSFGRELTDRFATGYRIEPRPGIMENASNEQKTVLQKRIAAASKKLGTCGTTEGVKTDDRMSLATFMGLQARNGLVFGKFATEIAYTRDTAGTRQFHSFRPVDAGTVYMAAPRHDSVEQVRQQALALLEKLRGPDADRLKPEKFENDEYAWVQVIDGKPRQAFTSEEMVVHQLYPITDIEFRGYPLSPIETCIDAISTHMNITQHNKMYFQSGRAARGIVVIQSTDVDQGMVAQIRQHFNASINSSANSFRVPVFGVDPEEDLKWVPMDMAGRDMEFQYLADQNAREILCAFHMGPEEIPGYQHLGKGTNSQSLSESSNEFKLTAARDVGIRPLLSHFQDFLNDHILPLIDPMVSQLCTLKLYGLDADTAEKESTRLQTDSQIHMSMDEILERTEKDPVGKEWGGKFLMNPSYQAILAKYFTVGEVAEHFFNKKGASQDPTLQYIPDPMWFNWQQLQLQKDQMAQQQQQAQQQAQQPQPGQGASQDSQDSALPAQQDLNDGKPPPSEIADGADEALGLLKSEQNLSPNKKRLLQLHKLVVKEAMDSWQKSSEEALAEIVAAVKKT